METNLVILRPHSSAELTLSICELAYPVGLASSGKSLCSFNCTCIILRRSVKCFSFWLRIVQEILCKLKDAELEKLRTRQYWRKAETLRMQAEVMAVK